MSRQQEGSNKKDFEKKKQQKKMEKEQRRLERKANAKEGASLEDMLAYVDENGNIVSTPPDPTKKKVIREEDIVIGVPRQENVPSATRRGRVTFFNDAKGFGFIEDLDTRERIFVHVNVLSRPLKENELVTFESEQGVKGPAAIWVKPA